MHAWCDELEQALRSRSLDAWLPEVSRLTRQRLLEKPHGDMARWQAALSRLPLGPAPVLMNQPVVTVGEPGLLDDSDRHGLGEGLRGLIPWRKGPFDFFGQFVDTEWRSDLKWERVVPWLSDLAGRRVLDVGSGSGYHCWRMRGAGADFVLGIDPGILFLLQFLALKRYLPDSPVWQAPVRLEELPRGLGMFDTAFSMGVLYHRRSPLDHLLDLREALRPGGELVLETLVVDGDARTCLMPAGRYAAMRNVFFLPSPAQLEVWLARCGFSDIRTVDVTATGPREQRATDWMRFQSLEDFLDPDNPSLTREGYPAPVRATLIARRSL